MKDSIAALDVQDAVIDGEIVALDEKGRSSFQLLQGLDMGQKKPPIVFYAFDLLRLNGKDLRDLPIEERKAKLEPLLKKPPAKTRVIERADCPLRLLADSILNWLTTEALSTGEANLK